MTNDTITLLHAHLSDDYRIKICLEFVEQLQKFGYEVIVATHTPAPIEFQQKVDYFVYDHDNCLLFEPDLLGYLTWYTNDYNVSSKEFFEFSSTLAVSRLIHIGTSYAKMLGKTKIHIFDYDGFLDNPNEMKRNEQKIDSGLDGVFYYWDIETDTKTLQVTTRFMSAKVDHLLKCFEETGDFHNQKSIIRKHKLLVCEEYMSYILNLTKHNSNKNHNIEILPFLTGNTGDPIIEGMTQDRASTNENNPWVALIPRSNVSNGIQPVTNFLFLMNVYADAKFDIYLDDVHYKTYTLYRRKDVGQYNSPWILEPISEDVKIDVIMNDNHFRTYDLRDEDRLNVLRICNSLHYK